MNYSYKGIKSNETKILDFVEYISNAKPDSLWIYFGLKVEIDPIFDFYENNVLIRWYDIEEEFNDKIIVHSLGEFQSMFKEYND